MTLDFDRLAHAAREARRDRGWRQEDVADRADVGLSSVQNMEKGRPFNRFPSTYRKIALALGWEEESPAAILRGGEPTLRQDGPKSQAEPQAPKPLEPARPAAVEGGAELPPAVRIALGMGELLGYDVWTTDVDGEPMQMIQIAVTNAQAVDALKKQLDRFGAITGYVRRRETGSGGADGEAADE